MTVYTFKHAEHRRHEIGTPGNWCGYMYPHVVLVVKSFMMDGKKEKGFGDVGDLIQLV